MASEKRIASNRRWREANPEKHAAATKRWQQNNPEKRRAYRIKQRYGLTVEEHDDLLAAGCVICGTHEDLGIDHCHVSGKVRGALCGSCNKGLGHFRDDPALLLAAINYLNRSR